MPYTRITLNSLIPKPYDFEPQYLGEHIKKKRLELGLLQKEVAKRFGVTTDTILNWEKGYSEPVNRQLPGIISFLGYSPMNDIPKTIPEMLKAKRWELGLTQEAAAMLLGVNESTLARWESGLREPTATHRARVDSFISCPKAL